MAILQDLNNKSQAELIEMVQALQTKAANNKSVIKVSAKGAVSVYGLQRWPVTLYAPQWNRLLDMADGIRDFMGKNKALLSFKHDSE